ncbi:MAG: hypothetical protein ACRDTA_16900 [Pseudonocardiaceae bacterium]
MGTPEKATGLRLDGELAEQVRQAVRAKEKADEVMRASFMLEDTHEHNGRNRDILERAYRLYDRSPYIVVNYGLVLMRCGQGRAAHDVLARIAPVLAGRLRAESSGIWRSGQDSPRAALIYRHASGQVDRPSPTRPPRHTTGQL